MFLKCFFLFILLFYFPVKAQDYPVKPIRAVVGFAPGGPADLVVRPVADKLYELLGQPIVVDYRPGANMAIASELVAKAAADGYTLLATTSAFTMNPVTHAKLSFDTLRDFIPISQTANSDFTLVINPGVPALTLVQFIQVAKSSPNKLTYGSSGNGGSLHMAGEMLKLAAGIKMLHVPYKGASLAMADVLGGHVDLMFISVPPAIVMIQAGKLRALATASLKRARGLPQVPTFIESGYADFTVDASYGLAAPVNTPKEIVMKLSHAVAQAVQSSDLKLRYANLGLEPISSTPEQYADFVRRDIAKWRKVVSSARLDLQ
jgi:tripartite-type tricarboxylate transporter receptor subunit TctC